MTKQHILIVEDDADLCEALEDILVEANYQVSMADNGHAALVQLKKKSIDVVLSDVHMQPMDGFELLHHLQHQEREIPMVLMTAYGTIEKAVEAMAQGAADYLVKPFEADALLNVLAKHAVCDAPRSNNHKSAKKKSGGDDFIAVSENMLKIKRLAEKVANSEATVLLNGESGVGKEVLAQYIWQTSPRSNAPFVAINCAAIPENMLESVLFGYEKGSFTGAVQSHPGKFEQAQGGTLLLDEISEMDIALQAKLLRVLQEREVERLGSRKSIQLDVRVLATTNRNLREEVAAGRFREDLFYRLNVFPMYIPALKNRPDDIVAIAQRLLEKHDATGQVKLAKDVSAKLKSYAWPGNVRELDNVIQRALILSDGEWICADDIQIEEMHISTPINDVPTLQDAKVLTTNDEKPALTSSLKDHEQQMIVDALTAGQGSRKYAAEKLGISPRTLRYKLAKMREFGIAIPG